MDLDGSLFLDARPSRDFRAFAKVKGDVRLTESPLDPNLRLHELFADFVLGDRAFFRVGKQTINWGVGYFFSPADIINVGRIDPENPEAEREGPVALRLNLPCGPEQPVRLRDRRRQTGRLSLSAGAQGRVCLWAAARWALASTTGPIERPGRWPPSPRASAASASSAKRC